MVPANTRANRFDKEGDWTARRFFSPAELAMSPEEYAARHAHLVGCFALDQYRYRDPILGAWIKRLGEILSCQVELDRCRQQFLSPEELAAAKQQEAGDF